ncbi:MAG: tryptophan synthase subunit alpha [Nitrosopumilales archaeon]|nr:tryptophan synthase subunit alpha [Nitrosopumilales archaeon]
MQKLDQNQSHLLSLYLKALIGYLMTGYPNEKDTVSAIRGLIQGGVDIIELGFPFSDPLADGPTIQNASTISLNKGTKLEKFFKILKQIRSETKIPLVLMTYTNILYSYGYDKFLSKAKRLGLDGIILPDMSIEESSEYLKAARKNHIDTIFLVSPNTSKDRIKRITKVTTGFLYLVSMYGTTGMRGKIQKYTINAVKNTKKIVSGKIPVGVGFGVSSASDVKRFVSLGADAVIVGSAFLRLIENTQSNKIESRLASFTRQLKQATKS